MDKDAILEYLYGLQMFGIKLGLENIEHLLNSVDNPHKDYGIVHVAGTNGKGSVCAFLRAMLQQAGYCVGCYTSPHLHQFNERITVDNQPIADDELAELVGELRQKNPHIPATFFEFTTALALLYFSRRKVDVVLLEVGMGGRLDATNAVTPLVSVITPISYDHAEYLGSTLEQITAEKGGIIKPHVPVVIADQPQQVLAVLDAIAAENHSPVWCYGRDYHCNAGDSGVDVVSVHNCWKGLRPQLPGRHQHLNLATALMALECLACKGYPVSDADVLCAVSQVFWPGRLEWFAGGTTPVLLDGAHNRAGAEALAAYLADYLTAQGYPEGDLRKILWVAGFKADKDIEAIMSPLLPFVRHLYATEPPIEQPYPLADIVDHVKLADVSVFAHSDCRAALSAALQECQSEEIVVVAGSLFLVAACRECLLLSR